MIMTAPVPLSAIARRYQHFLLDLDGCLYVGDDPTERATQALAALREASKGIVFLTNEVGSSPEEIVRKLWRLGFQASLDEVMTAGAALQYLLADSRSGGGAAYVIGSRALVDHVAEAGLRIVNHTEFATRADVVVVADHEHFHYGELRIATQAVLRGAELIGLSRDRTFPMPDGAWPGTGSILAAVETAAGRKADRVVGKPEPAMYEAARDRLGEGRILALGDRLDADVLGAKRAGLDSALVLTGATEQSQVDGATPRPTHVADSLAALLLT
jgi:glycerol-1-phosphatase